MTAFSHRIAKDSPFNSFGTPPVGDDCAASRQSQRILQAPDPLQLTLTSALTGFKTVPRVRIHSAPPRSLKCREIPLALRRNTRRMPVFRDYSPTSRTAENGLLRRD